MKAKDDDLHRHLQFYIEEAMGSVPFSVSSKWIAKRIIMIHPDVFKDRTVRNLTILVARKLTSMREQNMVEITFQTTYGHKEYKLVVS